MISSTTKLFFSIYILYKLTGLPIVPSLLRRVNFPSTRPVLRPAVYVVGTRSEHVHTQRKRPVLLLEFPILGRSQ